MEPKIIEDLDFCMLKDKIIATDQIIKIASEKDKIIKNLQSKYKKLIERFSEKQKEYELVLQNSKQFSDFCNKFHSSLEKEHEEKKEAYRILEIAHNDYINTSEIKLQTAYTEVAQEKAKFKTLLKKYEKIEKKDLKSPSKTNTIKIKKLEKEIDDKNEQVSDLEEKLVNLDLQRNNDLKRIAELQLECEQLKLKQNSPNNKKCSKSKQQLQKRVKDLETKLESKNNEIDMIKLSQDTTVEELTKKFEKEKINLTHQLGSLKNNENINDIKKQFEREKCSLLNEIKKLNDKNNVKASNVETQTMSDSDSELSNFSEILKEITQVPRLITPLPLIDTSHIGTQTEMEPRSPPKIVPKIARTNRVKKIIKRNPKAKIRSRKVIKYLVVNQKKKSVTNKAPSPVRTKPEANSQWPQLIPPFYYMQPYIHPFLPYYPNMYPQTPFVNNIPMDQKERKISRCSSRNSVQCCNTCQSFHLPLSPRVGKHLQRSLSADNVRSDFDSVCGSNESQFSRNTRDFLKKRPRMRKVVNKSKPQRDGYESEGSSDDEVDVRNLSGKRKKGSVEASGDDWTIPDAWRSRKNLSCISDFSETDSKSLKRNKNTMKCSSQSSVSRNKNECSLRNKKDLRRPVIRRTRNNSLSTTDDEIQSKGSLINHKLNKKEELTAGIIKNISNDKKPERLLLLNAISDCEDGMEVSLEKNSICDVANVEKNENENNKDKILETIEELSVTNSSFVSKTNETKNSSLNENPDSKYNENDLNEIQNENVEFEKNNEEISENTSNELDTNVSKIEPIVYSGNKINTEITSVKNKNSSNQSTTRRYSLRCKSPSNENIKINSTCNELTDTDTDLFCIEKEIKSRQSLRVLNMSADEIRCTPNSVVHSTPKQKIVSRCNSVESERKTSLNVSMDEFESYYEILSQIVESSDDELPYYNLGFTAEEIEDKNGKRERSLVKILCQSLEKDIINCENNPVVKETLIDFENKISNRKRIINDSPERITKKIKLHNELFGSDDEHPASNEMKINPPVNCDVVTHYKTKRRVAHVPQRGAKKIKTAQRKLTKRPIKTDSPELSDMSATEIQEDSTKSTPPENRINTEVPCSTAENILLENPNMLDNLNSSIISNRSTNNKVFKRPEKSKFKIIPWTPKSPDVVEYVHHEPIIIPLERAKQLKIRTIRKHIEKITNMELTSDLISNCIKFLSEQNSLKIASVIVEEAVKDVSLGLDSTHTPPAPLLNRVHQKLILFLHELSNISNHEKIHDDVLKIARQKLLNEKKIEFVHCLTRFYIGVSMQCYDAEQIRLLCVDSAYYMNDYFVPFLFITLTMYPEVLPTAEHLKTNSLVMQCVPKAIIQAIKLKNNAKPGFNLKNLNFLLTQYYGYDMVRANNDTLMEEFVKIYLDCRSKIAFTAIIILCKNLPNAWTFAQVKKYFMPLVNKNIHNKDAWEFVAMTIRLVTRLMQPLCYKTVDNDKVKQVRDWLSGIIEVESTLPLSIRTNVSEALNVLVNKAKTVAVKTRATVKKPLIVRKKRKPKKKAKNKPKIALQNPNNNVRTGLYDS